MALVTSDQLGFDTKTVGNSNPPQAPLTTVTTQITKIGQSVNSLYQKVPDIFSSPKFNDNKSYLGEGVTGYATEGYSKIRGILAEKNNPIAKKRILFFQFNPVPIDDTKEVDWKTLESNGFDAHADFWSKGKARTLSFSLFLDATAGSNTKWLGKDATKMGNASYDTLDSEKPNGIMDDVELLQSFQRPLLTDPNLPRFTSGGVIPAIRFMPPPVCVFVYGHFYLHVIVASVGIQYTYFDKKLIPRRGTASVTLKVIETEIAKQDPDLKTLSPDNLF